MKNKNKIDIDIKSLATLRDQLKLQFHLFDAEARERWEALEKDWSVVLSEVEQLKPVVGRAVLRASHASKPLLAKIEESLFRIREGVARHHSTK